MSVVCQCPSCKAKYQVGDQYAGNTIKCPKCSAAVVVPTGAQPPGPAVAASPATSLGRTEKAASSSSSSSKVELPKARVAGRVEDSATKVPSSVKTVKAIAISPADGAAESRDAKRAPTADDGLGFLAEVQAGSKRRAGPAIAERSPAEDQPVAVAGDGVAIPGIARSSKSDPLHRSKKKKKSLPPLLIATIAAAGVAVVGGIIYLVWSASSSTAGDVKQAAAIASKAEAPKVPVVTIKWPEGQRAGALLLVNGEKREIPPTGPIKIPLPPAKEPYHFRLVVPGFQEQTFIRASETDVEDIAVHPWEAVVQGLDGWEQDFKAAKQTAADRHKNVLLVFDASDAKASRFASSRFAEAIALRKEFRERADKDYVCVYIDNPEKGKAQKKVRDAARNRKVTEDFCITVFPTVVVTDPRGYPFGVMEDYKINGVNRFLELMDKWDADRKTLLDLLAKTETGGEPDLIRKALDFLEMNDLDRFYVHTIKKLTARLPAGEGPKVTEEAFKIWEERFKRASKNPDETKKVVEKFDRWKKGKTFADHDMPAKLHFFAAYILSLLGPEHRKEAAQKCQEGLAYEPHDSQLRMMLEQFGQILSGKSGVFPASSGTGFCVAQGNYVLTNHHVIAHAKEIKVHLNGDQTRYPAKLIADNESGDMAILKVELPAGKTLAPIPLATTGVSTGEEVFALGFPGVLSGRNNLTFTKGVVSTIPDPHDEEGFIATDCKVNPGNSGGPLCNYSGSIAGIVTRKSAINSKEDSYGLVIPIDRVKKFLAAKLPADGRKLAAPPAAGTNLKLTELYNKVGPSVVYIENLQEMKSLEHQQQHEEEGE